MTEVQLYPLQRALGVDPALSGLSASARVEAWHGWKIDRAEVAFGALVHTLQPSPPFTRYPMPTYVLPALPYTYSALEPHLSAKILELHHDKHHRAYVDAANAAVKALDALKGRDDVSTVAMLANQLAFNVSGHVLHSLFWNNLSPQGGGEPKGELAAGIQSDLGGFAHLKAQLNKAAETTQGSGWGALFFEPTLGRLLVAQIHDHQSNLILGAVPLMVLDAWEHAYYLQYQTEKARYFDAVWNLWNWNDIAERYQRARSERTVGLEPALTAEIPKSVSRPQAH